MAVKRRMLFRNVSASDSTGSSSWPMPPTKLTNAPVRAVGEFMPSESHPFGAISPSFIYCGTLWRDAVFDIALPPLYCLHAQRASRVSGGVTLSFQAGSDESSRRESVFTELRNDGGRSPPLTGNTPMQTQALSTRSVAVSCRRELNKGGIG